MNKKVTLSLWLILILEFVFIFTFLLNYDLAWMNPEKFGTHQWILSNGSQWKPEDWGKFLNIDVIEYNSDRLSRPLSNFVEVVNAKWRAWSWHYILPHPAISIIWPFMFLLLPYLLYLTFINMGCYPFLGFTGVCVYLSSVGFLGPLVMLFHPAKNLVNLFAVMAMYLFSLSYKRILNHSNSFKGLMLGGFISLYLGFISDETGLFTYLICVVLFYRLWIELWRKKHLFLLAGMLSLPFIYLLTIRFFLPWLHWIVRHKSVHLNNYESYPSIQSLFLPDWDNLWQNITLLFGDHPHWWFDYSKFSVHPVLSCIQIVYFILWVLLIFAGAAVFLKKHHEKSDKYFIQLAALGLLLLIGYCFFQTFQLSKNAKFWGIWWYGSLFSLIYTFTLVFFLQFVFSNKQKFIKWTFLLALVFVVNGLVFTTYRIAIFKNQNLNRNNFKYQDIFHNKMDIYQYFSFKDSIETSACKRLFVYLYWEKWGSKSPYLDHDRIESCQNRMQGDIYFMIENIYLNMELK